MYTPIIITHSCTPVPVHVRHMGISHLLFILKLVWVTHSRSLISLFLCRLPGIYLCSSLTSIFKILLQSLPEVGTIKIRRCPTEIIVYLASCCDLLLNHLLYHSHSSEHSRASLLVLHSLPACTCLYHDNNVIISPGDSYRSSVPHHQAICQ